MIQTDPSSNYCPTVSGELNMRQEAKAEWQQPIAPFGVVDFFNSWLPVVAGALVCCQVGAGPLWPQHRPVPLIGLAADEGGLFWTREEREA